MLYLNNIEIFMIGHTLSYTVSGVKTVVHHIFMASKLTVKTHCGLASEIDFDYEYQIFPIISFVVIKKVKVYGNKIVCSKKGGMIAPSCL